MAEQLSLEQETVQYYQWLMGIEHAEFEKELLDILSLFPLKFQSNTRCSTIKHSMINSLTKNIFSIGFYASAIHTR